MDRRWATIHLRRAVQLRLLLTTHYLLLTCGALYSCPGRIPCLCRSATSAFSTLGLGSGLGLGLGLGSGLGLGLGLGLGCRAERLLHVMPEASARAWRARHAGELAPLENLDDLTQPQPVAPLGQ